MANVQTAIEPIRVALLGAETLLGKELQEVLGKHSRHVLITNYSSSGEGNFGEQEGEAVYLEALNAETVGRHSAILLAGSPEGSLKAYELAKAWDGRILVIDCQGHLEQQPEAHIVAPLVAPLVDEPFRPKSWLQVIAHPAATALALVLFRMGLYAGASRVVANIFEPASAHGKRGIEELQKQTTSLLSFKTLDRSIYDAQLCFNLLPQLGSEAPQKLIDVEQRIEDHVASLLNGRISAGEMPLPSVRLVQAPVFHGYSISVWIEFNSSVFGDEIGRAIASAQVEVRGEGDEPPNCVGAASQSGVIVGDIRADRIHRRSAWLWIVCDNLRVTADAAADILSGIKVHPR